MDLSTIVSNVLNGFIEVNPIKTSRANLVKCYQKRRYMLGIELNLIIGIDSYFPYSLPHFFIEDYNKLNLMLPHVEADGYICFLEKDNILLDYENPEGILSESLEKVHNMLEASIEGRNREEFRREFISYWVLQPNIRTVVKSFIEPSMRIKEIKGTIYNNNLIVYDNTDENISRIKGIFGEENLDSNFKAMYIPIRERNDIYPPHYQKGWSIPELKRIILDNITSSNRSLFNKYKSRALNNSIEILILSIPITENNEVLIGLMLRTDMRKKSYSNPLHKNTDRFELSPLLVQRYDEDYLIERTSSDYSFKNKKVAIIGQGSLGSKVTMELARLGIRDFKLIDDDKLSIDNINRHELGLDSLFENGQPKSKVDAMSDELLRIYPDIDVEVEELNVINLLKEYPDYFDDLDIVLIAIGDTMTSLKLNNLFKDKNLKVIYSWLEPYGIGGHLLFIDYNKKGCYQCLYTDPLSENIVSNRASLAAEGQDFNKNMASCFSRFVPYGSVAPLKATSNIIEAFVDIVNNRTEKNYLLSWTGEDSLFLEEGYALSNRYAQVKNKEKHKTDDFKVENCLSCGS